MRVAVTGAAGYLGRPLVEALASDDRVDEVIALDRRPATGESRPATRWVQRDIRDPELARELEGIDALVHLAAVVLGSGRDAWTVNVDGSRNAFEAALRGGATAIVHASSGAAYGCAADNPVPLSEESPLRAIPPFYYPQTKVEVERMLDRLEPEHTDIRFVRMRPVSNLGPGAALALGGRVFPTLSDYDPLIQFVWVDDTVKAFQKALHSDSRGAFNVAAPRPVKSSQVAGLLGIRRLRAPYRVLRASARAAHGLRLPGALHPGWVDMGRYPIVLDTTRAERELGWRAGCDCATALRRFGELLRAGRPAPAAIGETARPREAGP